MNMIQANMRVVSISFCLLFLFVYIGKINAQKTVAGLDERLKNVLAISNLPGFAVAVVKDDQVLFSKGYGYADRKKKMPYTPETIQPVGSVSKTIIALAIMQCVDNGSFTLETDINEILPFKIINPYFPRSVIRIRHLVTHTSGLLDVESTYLKTYAANKKPTMELKEFLKQYYTPGGTFYDSTNFGKYEPGKKYSYSNIAASLAAYIVEIKQSVPFATYCTNKIFTPLKMTDSHWYYDEKKSSQYATLYEVNRQYDPIYKTLMNADGSLKIYSCISYPDGSLRTSLNDMTKYLVSMIKGYSGKPDLLTKKSFEILFRKQFTATDMPAAMDMKEPNRAVFWSYDRKGRLSHTGSDFGLAAFINFDPVTHIGRVVMINTELEGAENIQTIESVMNLMKSLDVFEQGK